MDLMHVFHRLHLPASSAMSIASAIVAIVIWLALAISLRITRTETPA
jgi:hypothetical protein